MLAESYNSVCKDSERLVHQARCRHGMYRPRQPLLLFSTSIFNDHPAESQNLGSSALEKGHRNLPTPTGYFNCTSTENVLDPHGRWCCKWPLVLCCSRSIGILSSYAEFLFVNRYLVPVVVRGQVQSQPARGASQMLGIQAVLGQIRKPGRSANFGIL